MFRKKSFILTDTTSPCRDTRAPIVPFGISLNETKRGLKKSLYVSIVCKRERLENLYTTYIL